MPLAKRVASGKPCSMKTRKNIALVGFTGTGKTTVGKALACRLGLDFLDMDEEITRRRGKSVARIFAEEGEAAFRALERQLVRELASRCGLVIATGGGIVLNQDNIDDLSRTGQVICLSLDLRSIMQRLGGDRSRPLLAGDNRQEKLRELLAGRLPLYRRIPLQVQRDGLDVGQTVERILSLLPDGRAGCRP